MDLKALDEFVNLPDPHYNYTLIDREISPYYDMLTYYDTINMTSQKWLDSPQCTLLSAILPSFSITPSWLVTEAALDSENQN
uniref:Uncharacterized protein n=1 Tax=Sphaerodactylus townsendi TaxID=933632 RepID=A0ACB8FFS4_9SAUR